MRIAAVSDLHSMLPSIPPCDLLLLAGDLCPLGNHRPAFQAEWLDTTFRRWLTGLPVGRVIGVAGNHDFVFEQRPERVPADLPWVYLQDSGTTWHDLSIWGTPWQPWLLRLGLQPRRAGVVAALGEHPRAPTFWCCTARRKSNT